MGKIDLNKLPFEHGCYLFKDKNEKIIYVGKANNLRKRVASYFSKNEHDPKTRALISNIEDVDFIITKNEIEALILENNLIKKNKPRYNINLRDSKTYAFIELTKEEFPRFIIKRTDKKNNGTLFGPFTSAKARDDILQIINKTFKLRTCNKVPKRACMKFHIGICSAPCINKVSKEEYTSNIMSALRVLRGDIEGVISELNKKMVVASDNQEFERAIGFREKINSLNYLNEKQSVERNKKYNEDIMNFIIKDNKIYFLVFKIYKGILENKEEFIFDYSTNFLEQFLIQYYEENPVPKEILLPVGVDDSLESFLSLKAKTRIVVPLRGEKKELMELVKKNIGNSFFGLIDKLNELRKVINLEEVPYVIECFDISHLSGTNIVASMVQFRNGRADKSNYRRFKIKSVNKNDDFASMKEVIKRRYKRLIIEKASMPHLILIDGGRGQLNSAIEELNKLSLKVPIISIAKKFEEVYVPGFSEPIKLNEKNRARLLLQEIRDEAHRFAIKYNRLLRKREIREKI